VAVSDIMMQLKVKRLNPAAILPSYARAGTEGQVRPRSGLALKHAITVLNTPGTVDEGYRGEVGVILINHGQTMFAVEAGMKIAQLVVTPRIQVDVQEVAELSDTQRGADGFGSTGA
jgi:dUTP pyrophosphatase